MAAERTLPVPRSPEPPEALKARYPKALERVYDAARSAAGLDPRPGECPENVFDFEDGLRMIVSRERLPDRSVQLHVSASFPEDCPLAADFRVLYALGWEASRVFTSWLKSVPRRFAALSGDGRDLAYVGMSDRLIPHWRIEEGAPCTEELRPTPRG